MTDLTPAIAAFFLIVLTASMAYYWGWKSHVDSLTVPSVQAYIKAEFPNQWAAYKKGVHEGYEQGLRDGQEMPNEPA